MLFPGGPDAHPAADADPGAQTCWGFTLPCCPWLCGGRRPNAWGDRSRAALLSGTSSHGSPYVSWALRCPRSRAAGGGTAHPCTCAQTTRPLRPGRPGGGRVVQSRAGRESVSWRCRTKLSPTGASEQQKRFPHGSVPSQGVGLAGSLQRLQGASLPPLPAPGGHRRPWACGHVTPVSPLSVTWPSPGAFSSDSMGSHRI